MADNCSILVGTLYSGENEFQQSRESLSIQSHTNWDHVVIEGLPEHEAHRCLYRRFMEQRSKYDLFLKLDPDMVFVDKDCLSKIVDQFKDRELGRIQFSLHDWISQSLIMGLHVYRSDAVWKLDSDWFYPDAAPLLSGKALNLWSGIAPIAVHSPDPSPIQAFRFGASRAQKSLKLTTACNPIPGVDGWRRLNKVWMQFVKTKEWRRGLALMAAEMVFSDGLDSEYANYQSGKLKWAFGHAQSLSAEEMYNELRPKWASRFQRFRRRTRMVGMASLRNIPAATINVCKRLVGA